jgi:hypothetical protein
MGRERVCNGHASIYGDKEKDKDKDKEEEEEQEEDDVSLFAKTPIPHKKHPPRPVVIR